MDDVDVRLAVQELQQRVAALEAQVAALTGNPSAIPSVPSAPVGGPETDPEVLACLQTGNEIGAIKAWRERTGLGLAEAKFAVDQARTRLGL
jgi:large subunit ribosomal protein L7/L12